MEYCFKCGNHGFPDKVCESCNREPQSLNLSSLSESDVKEFLKDTKLINIPQQYVGVEWNKDVFWRNHRGKENDLLLVRYLNNLEKIHEEFVKGLPAKGAIIVAPSTYSKIVFAYSCMQHALRNGYSVAPLLDTMEVQRLVVLASENPKYRLYNELTYDNYIMSDVVFITTTKTEYRKGSYSIVEEILDRRSRKGLSTFFLSRVGLEEMSQWDKVGNFIKLKEQHVNENNTKVPVLIGYKEGF